MKHKRLRTLNKFRSEFSIQADRNYYLIEESVLKQFLQYFLTSLLASGDITQQEYENFDKNNFNEHIKYFSDKFRNKTWNNNDKKNIEKYKEPNLMVAFSALESFCEEYKIFPKELK